MKEVGKAIQYPMKLGFAITVHKAQGQTYDEMNLVPEIFQDGQLYVALSRCKFARNLYISDPLNSRMVRASQEVVNYYKNPENYTFFGKEQDIISVQTSRECEGAVKLLSRVYKNHKSEVIDFLSALEKLDESTKNNKDSKTKEEPKDVSEEYLPLEELKFLTKESQRVEEVEQLSFGFEETTKPAPAIEDKQTEKKMSDKLMSMFPDVLKKSITSHCKKKKRCEQKKIRDIIVFDTETTGLSMTNDRITEIGAVMIRNGEIVDKFDTFVNPHKKIPKKITELTGISNEMVKDAPDENEAIDDFIGFCGDDAVLVAHNASFDNKFIQAACIRHGITFSYELIDTLEISRKQLPALKSHKLGVLAKHFQLGEFNAHRAVDDAEMTAKIYLKLTEQNVKAG